MGRLYNFRNFASCNETTRRALLRLGRFPALRRPKVDNLTLFAVTFEAVFDREMTTAPATGYDRVDRPLTPPAFNRQSCVNGLLIMKYEYMCRLRRLMNSAN